MEWSCRQQAAGSARPCALTSPPHCANRLAAPDPDQHRPDKETSAVGVSEGGQREAGRKRRTHPACTAMANAVKSSGPRERHRKRRNGSWPQSPRRQPRRCPACWLLSAGWLWPAANQWGHSTAGAPRRPRSPLIISDDTAAGWLHDLCRRPSSRPLATYFTAQSLLGLCRCWTQGSRRCICMSRPSRHD